MRSCYIFAAKAARRRGGQPRPAPMQGRPPMTRPRPRTPARGRLVAARASPQGRQPLAARHPQGGRLQGACKGLPPTDSPVASRGGGADRRGGCPLVGRLPTGKGNRRLRKRGKGKARVSFH
ncbi:hypothetical protein BHE74_00058191 [Ensete ventricosum]|nr:hypothetical protein BHE74_00058191 [Ensete ventricosum]